jgi:protein-tyrosine-phosphatase
MGQPRVLFIATRGAARAQLAAGLLQGLGGERFAAAGATADVAPPDPLAERALAELGLPAAPEVAPLARYLGRSFERAITLCDGRTET